MADKAKTDYSVLTGSALLMLVFTLLGAAMVWGGLYFKASMQRDLDQQLARSQALTSQYRFIDDEERIIRDQYPLLVEMYRNGIVGSEARLTWHEALRRAKQQQEVAKLTYKVDARTAFSGDLNMPKGPFEVYVSSMQLDAELVHEGDLLTFIDRLNADAQGLFSFTACDFRRRAAGNEPAEMKPRLSLGCELDWYTVDLSGDEGLVL